MCFSGEELLTTQQIIRHSIVTSRHPATQDAGDRAVTGSTNHHRAQSRLLIIDDSALYRECLLGVLSTRPALAAHGIAWDSNSLIAGMQTTRPDVIMLNGSLSHSAVLVKQIRQIDPAVRVIVTGLSEEDESGIVACAQAGAAGFHLRSESLADLLVLIHAVAEGRPYCSPTVSGILLRHMSEAAARRRRPAPKGSVLTAREMQILHMLESGLANRDIADRLCIAVHTVKNHVHSVLTKLGVSSREQAAALARNMIATGELSAI
ncbi:hypothetical protein EB72_26855 [Mycobacterium sp. SWH-M1]|nr:hypothetical protein EB72_26855 [Mycobacterium sp. SWH-M1]